MWSAFSLDFLQLSNLFTPFLLGGHKRKYYLAEEHLKFMPTQAEFRLKRFMYTPDRILSYFVYKYGKC